VTDIRDLYTIGADIRGNDPAIRLAARQERSAPILARLDEWLHRSSEVNETMSKKGMLG